MTARMSAELAVDLTAPARTGSAYRVDRIDALIEYLGLNTRYEWEEYLDLRWKSLEAELEAEIEELGLED